MCAEVSVGKVQCGQQHLQQSFQLHCCFIEFNLHVIVAILYMESVPNIIIQCQNIYTFKWFSYLCIYLTNYTLPIKLCTAEKMCIAKECSLCMSTMQFNLIGLFYTVTLASKIKWTVHPCGRKVSWIVPWKLNLRWVCELRKLARSWLMELLRVPTSRLHSQFGSLQLMLI